MCRMILVTMMMTGWAVTTAIAQQPPTNPGAVGGTPGATQAPAPPALSPEQQKVLTDVLSTWETDAKSLNSLYVHFEETLVDSVFKGKPQRFFGEAKILKMPTGSFGLRLEMYAIGPDGKADYSKLHQKYICSGNWLYRYEPASKLIFFHRLENQSIKPDDGPFAFVFGMNALNAQRRFQMSIAQQDKDWTWIKVLPQTEQDRKDFVIAQLGLVNYANQLSPKYFPLHIQWREPGNNERTWSFKQVIRNDLAKVNAMDFTIEEDKKRGWTLKEVPAQGAMNPPPAPIIQTGAPPAKK